jgi:hypothetical protein
MRKLWFAHTACALVAFPGGFGLDEMFEILTLQQTAKLDRTIVMLLYGSDYWRESSTSTPWFVTARSARRIWSSSPSETTPRPRSACCKRAWKAPQTITGSPRQMRRPPSRRRGVPSRPCRQCRYREPETRIGNDQHQCEQNVDGVMLLKRSRL